MAASVRVSRPPFSLAALDHVVLRVPDMERALAFYRGVLGAEIERRIEKLGIVQLRAGEAIIDLVDVAADWLKAEGARPFTPEMRNVDHICVRIDPFDEAALEAHLAAHGVAIIERGVRYGAQGDGPSFYVCDPFGTVIELKGPATPIEADEPVLKTARLVLRPTRLSDAEALLPLFQDPEMMRYWAHGPIATMAEMREIIARNLPPRNRAEASFAITRDGRRALGLLNFYAERDMMAGLGYILEKPSWGQGLVAEALQAAIDHGFTRLKLHRIWLEIDPRNDASLRVAERAGFSAEGVFRKSFFMDGTYYDSAFYALLFEEWLKTRGEDGPSGR
ncbi:MAG: GNAT family N-acetyltransferase [Alphaproteobacteria bacterium]|nr:GNAT family N-acetyltransferase [Alphaproteobacteria bacterium]